MNSLPPTGTRVWIIDSFRHRSDRIVEAFVARHMNDKLAQLTVIGITHRYQRAPRYLYWSKEEAAAALALSHGAWRNDGASEAETAK